MKEHIDKSYENDLRELKDMILSMGSNVLEMISLSQKAIIQRDNSAANETIAKDNEVDEFEVKIHKKCTELLALRQPAAWDLRFIILGIRIITDLERMGDSTKTISRKIIEVNQQEKVKEYVDLPKMFTITSQMVQDSLQAFVNGDTDLARKLIEQDDIVDDYQEKIINELVDLMRDKPNFIQAITLLIEITNRIERIADHATNVAEQVIYLVEAKDIRHQKTD